MIVNTVLTPREISYLREEEDSGWTGVVFDVLRATTSIVTGLAHGVAEIIPVETIEEAKAWEEKIPHVVLGGERHGDRIPGFAVGNSPAEYTKLPGATVVTTTTNGTVAIRACAQAERTFIASLLNLQATAAWIAQNPPPMLRILCAGTFADFSLEDAIAAGLLVRELQHLGLELELGDSSLAVQKLAEGEKATWSAFLRRAKNAEALRTAGRGADIEWALRLDEFPVVVQWNGHSCQVVT